MAKFERGDLVVYVHKDAPAEGRGALAIISHVNQRTVDVQWITLSSYLATIQDQPYLNTNWDYCSFEKVGHLDDF